MHCIRAVVNIFLQYGLKKDSFFITYALCSGTGAAILIVSSVPFYFDNILEREGYADVAF
ncbi:hypothetical protein D7V32_10160 [Acinetobacter tianfuensis]|uniref:Uncharacterized protein n=1 Tax=Acinetobacter tianfuensis TaxID=2419603 RepID=A0A3A8ELJ5_9GAMM|nr:hypothetical protein D7V32_10160 [Acinetobacter tianfuensis]